MRSADYVAFESRMRERGYKRGTLCAALGVSQSKWRRIVEAPGSTPIGDRTLELACSALELADTLKAAIERIEQEDFVGTGSSAEGWQDHCEVLSPLYAAWERLTGEVWPDKALEAP